MIRIITVAAAVMAVVGTANPAFAEIFTFNYSDTYGDSAYGTLVTSGPSGLADGSQQIVDGNLTITANAQNVPGNGSSRFPPNHYVGTYPLLHLANGPYVDATLFHMQVDNLLYPNGNATSAQPGQSVPGTSYLDDAGLAFGSLDRPMTIYAIGNGVYGLAIVNLDTNGQQYVDFAAWAPETGSLSLTPVTLPGVTQYNPLLPSGTVGGPIGGYEFSNVPSGHWIDPPFADGFTYTMTSGDHFTSIGGFPTGFNGPFTVTAENHTWLGSPGLSIDFKALLGHGVSSFTVSGISPLVDAGDSSAFPLLLNFDSVKASFTMTPHTVPEPGTLLVWSLAGGIFGIVGLRKRL